MNHPLSVRSPYAESLPILNRNQLPVVVHSLPQKLDTDPSLRKNPYILKAIPEQHLKSTDEEPKSPTSTTVVDLDHLRSLFFLPLGYLRRYLFDAYRWAQDLLSLNESPSKVDLYV